MFFSFGEAYALRLLVSVFSLRRHYGGPVTVFLARDGAGVRLKDPLASLNCEVVFVDHVSKSWDRHHLFDESPYATTLVFDSDLIFLGPIDELWEPLEREGVLATRFFPAPYGVDGTRTRPGWSNRVWLLNGVKDLVDADVFEQAARRLVEERIDVNVGVLGVARPLGDDFLADWSQRMERGRDRRIPLMDEMLVVALLARHRHFLADEQWNCPADEFCRRTNLADARVLHYFADGIRVHGIRLGRNPATWAGKKWYDTYREACRVLDLRSWEAADPTFTPAVRRLFALGPGRGLRLLHTEARGRLHHVRRRAERSARALLRVAYFPIRQAVLAALARTGYRVELGTPHRATVVVLSYKRMSNIPAIVHNALMCGFVDRVVVSNNNPDVDLRPVLPIRDPRFRLIQHECRRWPSYRYEVAREHPADYYLCIDDDVFPSPWQLKKLFAALLADPAAPVGNEGQIHDPATGNLLSRRRKLWYWRDQSRRVDVLVQIYAFTRAHLERYFELLRAIGIDNSSVHSSEDVVLSFTGSRRPLSKDVGEVFDCATSREDAIAVHRGSEFETFRRDLFQRLSEVR